MSICLVKSEILNVDTCNEWVESTPPTILSLYQIGMSRAITGKQQASAYLFAELKNLLVNHWYKIWGEQPSMRELKKGMTKIRMF